MAEVKRREVCPGYGRRAASKLLLERDCDDGIKGSKHHHQRAQHVPASQEIHGLRGNRQGGDGIALRAKRGVSDLFLCWTNRDPEFQGYFPGCRIMVSPAMVTHSWNVRRWEALPGRLMI